MAMTAAVAIFRLENEEQRPAAAFAHDDHDAALAGPVLHRAAVVAVSLARPKALQRDLRPITRLRANGQAAGSPISTIFHL